MKKRSELKYLSSSQLKEFFEKGFLILKNLFNIEELEKIKILCESLQKKIKKFNNISKITDDFECIYDNGNLVRIVWCGALEKGLLDLGEDHRIIGPISELLNTDIFFQIINQAHFKMPGENVEFEWHQDSQHRRYGTKYWDDVNQEGSYIQSGLAIDNMTLSNGTLKFMSGSSLYGHLDLPNNKNWKKIVEHCEIVKIEMSAGDLVLFGPYTIHSSSANLSLCSRRMLINGYAYPEANKKIYPGAKYGKKILI